MKAPEPVKAVIKTLRILESLSHHEKAGVTELAKSVGMNKSTTYRFLHSLRELGYVAQDADTEHYSLTLKLFEVGSIVLDRMELWNESRLVMKNLARVTGETIHLGIIESGKLVYIGKLESTQTLRVSMSSRVGQGAPTYCTGLGKALLANLPPDQIDAVLKSEEIMAYTEKTITRRQDIDRELEQIRKVGYSIDNEEHEVGVRCIAAPIRDNRGEVAAAISISMPSIRMTSKEQPRFRRLVLEAASEISARLGYRPERLPSSPAGA
jgi:IclR family KDG regulon transcriptional repressor